MHVYAKASPGAEFDPVEPDVKDVYFSVMSGHHGRRRPRRETRRSLSLHLAALAANAVALVAIPLGLVTATLGAGR